MNEISESDDSEDSIHIPVMLNEIIEYLKPQVGGIYVDGTLGLGGHAKRILNRIGTKGLLIGIDRDSEALALAQENLSSFSKQCKFIHSTFSEIDRVVSDLSIDQVNGILLDLGVSSLQFNTPERGFSLQADGPLDMRMNQQEEISAFDLVNSLSEKEIGRILRDFGEERWYQRIAKQIVYQRKMGAISTTKDLTRVVMRALPQGRNYQKMHPATRTFQAFRIAVNRELDILKDSIRKCVDVLKPQGRLCIISFHSLEDRIVKHCFKDLSKEGKINLITKKPLRPIEEEVTSNPRSRSALLRVAERII